MQSLDGGAESSVGFVRETPSNPELVRLLPGVDMAIRNRFYNDSNYGHPRNTEQARS